MVSGVLLLFSPCIGLFFVVNNSWAFLNVARISDPAVTSSTNNIVLCTTATGLIGFLLLALSLISFFRNAHPHMQTHHTGNP